MIKEDTEDAPRTPAKAAPIAVTRVDHVGIMVRDIDRAVDWYVSALGMVVGDRWEDRDADMAWAHLEAGSHRIELVQRPALTDAPAGTRGLHHVALVVADCSAATAALAEMGGEIVRHPSYFGRHDMDWSFVRDPFGNILEIVSYRGATDPKPPEHQGSASQR